MGKNNIKKYVKSKLDENPVIVEIGAHYGEDSIDFVRAMNPSCVHCFEPDPRAECGRYCEVMQECGFWEPDQRILRCPIHSLWLL